MAAGATVDISEQILDRNHSTRYNKDEERTTHAVAPQVTVFCSVAFRLRKQPSLGRVAVAFYSSHDNRDRITPKMKCNSHLFPPPLGDVGATACAFVSALRPFRAISIVPENAGAVNPL